MNKIFYIFCEIVNLLGDGILEFIKIKFQTTKTN